MLFLGFFKPPFYRFVVIFIHVSKNGVPTFGNMEIAFGSKDIIIGRIWPSISNHCLTLQIWLVLLIKFQFSWLAFEWLDQFHTVHVVKSYKFPFIKGQLTFFVLSFEYGIQTLSIRTQKTHLFITATYRADEYAFFTIIIYESAFANRIMARKAPILR